MHLWDNGAMLRWLLPLSAVHVLLMVSGCAPVNEDGDCMDANQEAEIGTLDTETDSDGDGIDDCSEIEQGTNPTEQDSDGDGLTDLDELDCVSDPLDAGEQCYACGWPHGDPGNLNSRGNDIGDTIADVDLVDQCGEQVPLWDFTGKYYILFLTAAW